MQLQFFPLGRTQQLALITRKKTDTIKDIAYFLYFSSFLRIWSQKERKLKRLRMHPGLTGDLFNSTVRRDSHLSSEYACFYKQIYSKLTTHVQSGHQVFSFQLVTLVLFASRLWSAISLALSLGYLTFHFSGSQQAC